ncbi:MAG: DUF4340 domain-containing protein [Bacteroidetes bacterium]|nr:DUF4340 domain-containing protein [Bacteroidota bacterium]
MKKNNLKLIIVVILAVVALYFIYSATSGTIPKALTDFAVKDTSIVTKIFLTDKSNNKVLLEKKAPQNWSVNNTYTASNEMINIMLKTIMRLEVKAPVAKAARNNVIKRLASSGVKVEIYQTVFRIDFWKIQLFPYEKLVKTYYVGDATQDNMGTYMLIQDSDEPFIMHIPAFRGFLNTRYSTIANDWRNHTIYNFEISQIKSVKLEFPSTPEKSFLINNVAKDKFTLTSLSNNQLVPNYDTLKLFDYLTAFRDVKFEFIIEKNSNVNINQDSILASSPFNIITLTEMSGKTNILKTYHKKGYPDETGLDDIVGIYDKDRLFASINDGKDFVIIQFFVFDNILRPLSYFVNTYNVKKIH